MSAAGPQLHRQRPALTCAPVRRRWLPVVARCLPMALYLLFLAAWPATTQHAGALLFAGILPADPRWLYAVRIDLVIAALAFFAPAYVELAWPRALPVKDWALAVLAGAGVFAVWLALDSGWAVLGTPRPGFVPLDAAGQLIWPLVVVRILGAAIVVPLMEELFWRSFVQRWIDAPDFLARQPGAVSWRSLLLTSLAFGFEHSQWLAGILAGVSYGYLYRRSGTLWSPIVAHALTNLLLGLWVVGSGQWHFW